MLSDVMDLQTKMSPFSFPTRSNKCLLVPVWACQRVREFLQATGRLDSARKVQKIEGTSEPKASLPISNIAEGREALLLQELREISNGRPLDISILEEKESVDVESVLSPAQQLLQECKQLMKSHQLWRDDLAPEVPRHWQIHGDLALLPSKSFAHPNWQRLLEKNPGLWDVVCDCLGVNRLAIASEVTSGDGLRRPRDVRLLHPAENNSPWVRHVDNGIIYTWDVTKCMFSAGNVTEKIRVAKFNCEGETVVDMFAGIGYFALPYLVHARAAFLHACEWNPDAAEALAKNFKLNKVEESRYKIHLGDNRVVSPVGVADRVNLGLVPTAEASYEAACRALRPDVGGVLHIHANVKSSGKKDVQVYENSDIIRGEEFSCKLPEWQEWSFQTASKVRAILQRILPQKKPIVTMLLLTRVKSYAPRVDHLVLDLRCELENS